MIHSSLPLRVIAKSGLERAEGILRDRGVERVDGGESGVSGHVKGP